MQFLIRLLILINDFLILIPFKHFLIRYLFLKFLAYMFLTNFSSYTDSQEELIIRKLEDFRYSELNPLSKQGR